MKHIHDFRNELRENRWVQRESLCQYLDIVTQGKWRDLKVIYEKTRNIDAVRRLLGHFSVTAISSYIGVTGNSALNLART